MDITPAPEHNEPHYPKARGRARCRKQKDVINITLAGDVAPPLIARTPEEQAIADEILSVGWDHLQMQLLGGDPMINGSPEQIEQEKRYRCYRKVYNRLRRAGLLPGQSSSV